MTQQLESVETALLEHLEGRQPPRPPWFSRVLAIEPDRERIDVDGTEIELLTWGERGKPGLLFLHGNAAHADWWSFIAPYFADSHRVAAFSWSGMGNSDWRENYSIEAYTDEIEAAATAAGLFEADHKPIVIAHSFGSSPALAYAATRGEKLGGLVSMDSPILNAQQRAARGQRHRDANDLQANRVYPTMEAALKRFRFLPAQGCENLFIVDHIARKALDVVMPWEKDGPGYVWCFDPFLWKTLKVDDTAQYVRDARCPLAFIAGENSALMDEEVRETRKALAPPGSPIIDIPQAAHHLMADQPLAVVSALRTLLAAWPG